MDYDDLITDENTSTTFSRDAHLDLILALYPDVVSEYELNFT